MYEQQDIVLIPFPYSDLTGTKQRPALIISNKRLGSDDKICCLITSKKPRDGIEITAKLPFKSWVKPHRVFTVNNKIIKKKISQVSKQFHGDVLRELNKYLD